MARKKLNKYKLTGFITIIFGLAIIKYQCLSTIIMREKEKQAIKEFYQKTAETTSQKSSFIESKNTDKNSLNNDNKDIDKEINKEDNISKQSQQIEKINYLAILKIPKINLTRGLVNPDSYLNNVDYNIEIVKGSDMPDVLYGNFILAAHSGNSSVSYFKNLDKLENNDIIEIDYKNNTYKYKVVNKYEIEKNGELTIKKDYKKKNLTLITCKRNTNNQIVVIANQV